MQQVPENSKLERIYHIQVIDFFRVMVRCGTLALAIVCATGCGSHEGNQGGTAAPTPPSGAHSAVRTLKRGLPGEPQTLDPQLADDTYSFQVLRDIYEGLTAEDGLGRIVPGVAIAWSVDETGTVYTFRIRPDAKWSDGKPIVAKEFVEGLRRAVDPKTASGSAALLTEIKGASEIVAGRKSASDLRVSSIGDSTVLIELEHPAPYILQILSQPIAAPVYLRDNTPSNNAAGNKNRETNGPYVLRVRVPNSYIELERNPFYWDAANVAIAKVRYVNAESESTELREYDSGELDMTFTIPISDLKRVQQQNGSEVQMAPILGTFYLALNLSYPPLIDRHVLRQALSMAVDRDAIAQNVMMGVTPAYTFVSKGITGYKPPEYDWSKWSRDRQLSLAKTLFAQSGYSPEHPLHLRLYYNRDEGIQRIMVAIAGSWKKNLGVESELISNEFRVFLAGRRDRRQWDVARLAWNADYDDPASFLEVFARDNVENDPGYKSASFNDLLEKARIEPLVAQRIALLQQSERVLLDDYPIIPIYFYTARRLVKPYVGGAEITPMNRTYSKHLFWKSSQ
jgi:ABC-type oligopeptide transport system substrate-binding subunit